ncbi:ABC transporter permease [Corynebacterium pelargi]|uniref:Sulfate transport system permease protein CysW n=1 Tax=Corynebacterium pelargi TaxID=1471400 RepID=A0A410WBJ4_9CORY|nr:iron ABC transporter permease [Corynebacterium pelargi]QAU53320.1 Sulfate transport system permease protein CysW [Corynebacterium pelargi]GGG73292.1 iron ABC transporter permease [Corynebacterium pelargi]
MITSRRVWTTITAIVVLLMLTPLLGILAGLFAPASDAWHHIVDHLLAGYIWGTFKLVIAVVFLSVIVASALAWWVTAYEFPGRSLLSLGLVLPLAIPPYIGGYTYVAMTGYTGWIQVGLRNLGVELAPGSFDLLTPFGAVLMFTLFLYPYIFLVLRAFLSREVGHLLEAARVSGASPMRAYFTVILPLTRNAVVAGATLVAFEVLSDYGLASYFGLEVFTTAIFKSWLGLGDMAAALKLAAILLLVVTLLSAGEKALRGPRSASIGVRARPMQRMQLRGPARVLVPLAAWSVLAFALLIPVIQMIYWAIVSMPNIRFDGLMATLGTSVAVALAGALATTICALIVAQTQRLWPSAVTKTFARITVMGYSVPSTVIALAILSVGVWLDTRLGTALTATPAIIVVAYLIRYLAVSMQSVESGFERVGIRAHESARLLGAGPLRATATVDVPMIRSALIGAFLLAFIDMMKELPIVLILRPFNFATLSTRVFEYANDEMIPESSLSSLLIIGIAMIPIALIVARQSQENPHV